MALKKCHDIGMEWISSSFVDTFNCEYVPNEKRARVDNNENDDPFSVASYSTFCDVEMGSKPWTEKYRPKSMDDLVINKKKMAELESWLKNVWRSDRKILLMTGPPGCGKTSALNVLCNYMNVSIVEWASPVDIVKEIYKETDSRPVVQSFQDFILRSAKYSSVLTGQQSKRLVLVKDFPSVFFNNSELFHEIIEKKCHNINSPLVFIVTCSNIIRELFPDDFKVKLNISTINFNPVTESSMLKALQRILVMESKRKKTAPSKTDLVDICDSTDGDLRSAILKLQFNLADGEPIFKVPKVLRSSDRIKVKKHTAKGSVKHKICEIDKDRKIDFFKSVGRVLYPKKEPTANGGYKFVHPPDGIVDSFITEPNKLLTILHENYLDRFSSIKDVSNAAASLCISDVLFSCWEGRDVSVRYGLMTTVRSLMTRNLEPTPNSWKPISKSRIWNTEEKRKENVARIRKLFPDVKCESAALLDFIPYLNKLRPNLLPDQQAVISAIANYK